MDPILAELLAGGGFMDPPPPSMFEEKRGSNGEKINSSINRRVAAASKTTVDTLSPELDNDWDIYNHGPLSPMEAFRLLRRPRRHLNDTKSRDSNAEHLIQGTLVLILGLWNTHIRCGPSEQGLRLAQLMKFALSQQSKEEQKRITRSYNFSLSTVVLNDEDEEFSDFLIDGPFCCPNALPALALYLPPSHKQVQEANKNHIKIHLSSRLRYIPMEAHQLRLLLTDFSEDERSGGHTETDSKLLFSMLNDTIQKLNNLSLQDYIDSEEKNSMILAVSMGGSAGLEMARKQANERRLKEELDRKQREAQTSEPPPHKECIRIFISGDRSQVGKTTICLGLLGSLLHLGYKPQQLAYIKPATQCEKDQPVAQFCQHHGISCTPIGPIVYYKGFTREYLKGNTESAETLLARVSKVVDELAEGRQILIIDGVGYPAVGSITGTSNAKVAQACGYPITSKDSNNCKGEKCDDDMQKSSSDKDESNEVIRGRLPVPVMLVGKNGVGDAIDSYCLNSSFFEASNVTVLGAVFNRFALSGYYSLSNCQPAIESAFAQSFPGKKAFGFLPEITGSFSKSLEKDSATSNEKDKNEQKDDEKYFDLYSIEEAEAFVIHFMKHVDAIGIIAAAKKARTEVDMPDLILEQVIRDAKRIKVSEGTNDKNENIVRTRDEIEREARAAGAKTS